MRGFRGCASLLCVSQLSISHLGAAQSHSSKESVSDKASLIESIVQGWGGRIPQPFPEFEKMLEESEALRVQVGSAPLQSVFVPVSRSAQKREADFAFPRKLLRFGFHDERVRRLPPPLYIGYAPRAHEIEIISWTPSAGRYDFFIFEGYGPGQTPRLQRADRDFCLSCHQGGGPIFSRAPWSEISSNPELFSKIMEHQQERERNPVLHAFSGFFPSQEKPFNRALVHAFDESVRLAQQHLQAARLCREFCQEDQNCWSLFRHVSQAGLTRPTPSKEILDRLQEDFDRKVSERTSYWSRDGFSYPSSVLADVNPLSFQSSGGQVTVIHLTDANAFGRALRESNLSLERYLGENLLTFHELLSLSELTNIPGTEVQKVPLQQAVREASPARMRPSVRGLQSQDAWNVLWNFGATCFGLTGPQILQQIRSSRD